MPGLPSTYGRELFRAYTPSSLRPVADHFNVDLMSTGLMADCKDHLGGPLVEVSFPGVLLLEAVLRAVRHNDAVLAVVVDPPAAGAMTFRQTLNEILETAQRSGHDRPIAIVTRALSLSSPDATGLMHAVERLSAVVDAGVSGVTLRPADVVQNPIVELTRAVRPLLEIGIGIEVEVDGARGALFLAALDEIGLPLAAVRGASSDDEMCGGVFVVDPLSDEIPDDDTTARVVLDGFLLRAMVGVLGDAEKTLIVDDAADTDVGGALLRASALVAALNDAERSELEATAYSHVSTALNRIGAKGTATKLLDMLAAEYFGLVDEASPP